MKHIEAKGIEVVIYELVLEEDDFYNPWVVRDIDGFKTISDVALANRLTEESKDVEEKVYTIEICLVGLIDMWSTLS